MDGFLIPFLTFFSRTFYTSVSRDSANKGFLYLLYLSGIFTVAITIALNIFVQPEVNKVIAWIKKDMPVLTVSRHELKMDKTSPYTMTYPEIGPVVIFDMTKETITPEQMNQVPVFVTRTHFYIQENQQTRIYSLKEALNQNPNLEKETLVVNQEFVDRLYKSLKPPFFAIAIAVSFVALFFWKVLAALIYSLPAMGFNSMRTQKLSYGKILDLTVYALTPATIFQIVRMLIPALNKIPFISVLDISITLAYVYFAIKMSETDSVRVAAPGFSR